MPRNRWSSYLRMQQRAEEEEEDCDFSTSPVDDRLVWSGRRCSWIRRRLRTGTVPAATGSSRWWCAPLILVAIAIALSSSRFMPPLVRAGGNVTSLSLRRTSSSSRSRVLTAFFPSRRIGTGGFNGSGSGSSPIGFCVNGASRGGGNAGGRLLVRRRLLRNGEASASYRAGEMPPFRNQPRPPVAGVDVDVDGEGFALRGFSLRPATGRFKLGGTRDVHGGEEVVDDGGVIGDAGVHQSHPDDEKGGVGNEKRAAVFFPYGIASVDLSERWVGLVREGHVRAELTLPGSGGDGGGSSISYGVRVKPSPGEGSPEPTSSSFSFPFEEYVEVNIADEDDEGVAPDGSGEGMEGEDANEAEDETRRRRREMLQAASRINATLSFANRCDDEDNIGIGLLSGRCHGDPGYAAQVQLVRTLRPPPSAGMRKKEHSDDDDDEKNISAVPPPYDPATDSFVTGPLRLWGLRPLAAKLVAPANASRRIWDVYHSVSPVDVRGHFLLVPDLDDPTKSTWRGQRLLRSDCVDLVALASTIKPPGSLCVGFNSVGGGASQNHVHAHLWPCPPLPLMGKNGTTVAAGWECYPASRARPVGKDAARALLLRDDSDSREEAEEEESSSLVRVELIDYPCCAVRLTASSSTSTSTSSSSSSSDASSSDPSALDELGGAVASVLDAIGDRPHNVCILNRPSSSSSSSSSEVAADAERDVDDVDVDVVVHVFVRSREGSPNALKTLRLGSSEVMGLFHCQSEEELAEAVLPSDDRDGRDCDGDGDGDGRGGGGSPPRSTSYDCSAIEVALRDVSAPPREVWDSVRTELLLSNHDVDDDWGSEGKSGGRVWTEEQCGAG